MNAQDHTKITSSLTTDLDEIKAMMNDGRDRKGKIVRNRGIIKELLIRFQGAMLLSERIVSVDRLDELMALGRRWRALRDETYGDA